MKTPPLSLLLLFLLSLTTSSPTPDRRRRHIDDIIHSAALQSRPKHRKTAVPYNVSLPPALAGATAMAMRFRAGRLRRQGVNFSNFRLSPGVVARPHSKRLLIVLQDLGNLSNSLYSVPHHQLISPVLGLLVYDAVGMNSTELDVRVREKPIEVNFSGMAGVKEEFLCAVFGLGGRVNVSVLGRGRVCYVKGQGHIGVVVEGGRGEGVKRWKVAVAGAVAGAAGTAMIGLVAVAAVKGRRKERRLAEMERRGYEDEALRVSMVGNSRAYTAAPVRTSPEMEKEHGFTM